MTMYVGTTIPYPGMDFKSVPYGKGIGTDNKGAI